MMVIPPAGVAWRGTGRFGYDTPYELGLACDPRLLGVALRRIVLRPGTWFVTTEMDAERLAEGFRLFEQDSRKRWTDGEAAPPDALFAGFTGACELVLHLASTTH